jgi:D-arginine dehydrogenase
MHFWIAQRAVPEHYDLVIIGAGMAGASLAAALGSQGRVLLLEAEEQPGYHATGRSAAFWTESYGGPGVQPLTSASGRYLRDNGFLARRGALTLARAGQEARVEQFTRTFSALGVRTEVLDRRGIAGKVPGLREDWSCGSWEPDCCDIDVAALHQHYLAKAQANGARLSCSAQLMQAELDQQGWRLAFADGSHSTCDILVNAAGAWADEIARLSGARPLGIIPMRRTIAQLRVTPSAPTALPLVLDIDEKFYFKPEAGRLWLSPHDETPSQPCDAAPEELDIALAIARLEEVVDWQIGRVERKWAGLRSFAPDRLPVYGFDLRIPRFFWFAGQGGFGIQTAPAAAELAARLIVGATGGEIDPARYTPARFDY